jgi:hypothetical protein
VLVCERKEQYFAAFGLVHRNSGRKLNPAPFADFGRADRTLPDRAADLQALIVGGFVLSIAPDGHPERTGTPKPEATGGPRVWHDVPNYALEAESFESCRPWVIASQKGWRFRMYTKGGTSPP